MILSINGRMLVAASIILTAFLGVTGATLERSFRLSAEEALKERLQVHMNSLITSVDEDEKGGVYLAYALPESRFFVQDSGLYSKIFGNNGDILWASPSLQGVDFPARGGLDRGEQYFQVLETTEGSDVLAYSIGLTWGEYDKFTEGYTFVVAERLDRMEAQIKGFRRNLWMSLGGVTVVLLVMLTVILRWGLAPLRKVAEDLRDVESGRHLRLEGEYPKELTGLTSNLNALLHNIREHEARYQTSLGDLAHSLKTPLAVLRGSVEAPHQDLTGLRSTVEEQVGRMDQIVQYQLQRAAASGRRALTAPVALADVVGRVVHAMEKVHADKGVQCQLHLEPNLEFHCDEGDLMEVLGNLTDNAFKWCRQRVEVAIRNGKSRTGRAGVVIAVGDDGPGIAQEDLPTVLSRGGRIDPETAGHGLGLAMVADIVGLYEGELSVGVSSLGGAQVSIWFPNDIADGNSRRRSRR